MTHKTFHVGFTGTQDGMTTDQLLAAHRLLMDGRWKYLHHGDCIGADSQVNHVAIVAGLTVMYHPPLDQAKCAKLHRTAPPATVAEPAPYLERNKAIVDSCELLIAAPKETTEQVRSGTWSTVRYARKRGVPVVLLLP